MKFGRCLVCDKSVEKEGYSHKCANEDAHFPGCHKVHIECANKAITELKAILFKLEAENQMDDWMRKLPPVNEWLERWKGET